MKTIFAYSQTMPVIGGFLSKLTNNDNFIIIILIGKSTFMHTLVDYAAADGKRKEKADV